MVGEKTHWESKGAFNGCNASMSQATSANTQMTRSERKYKRTIILTVKMQTYSIVMKSLVMKKNKSTQFLQEFKKLKNDET